ncbi:MAG: methyltransferase [Bacteroidales bacterium]|nr:methyltransferase [Bacteroidales bacterium]
MNSRYRVMSAVAHKEPDKVPVDLGSNPSSGISAIAYSNLVKYLGKDFKVKIYDIVQQLAQPDDEILGLFGVDVLDIGRMFNEKEEHWHPTVLADGTKAYYPKWFNPEKDANGDWIARAGTGKAIAKMPEDSTFFDQTYFPWVDGYPPNAEGLDEAMAHVPWAAFVHSPWDNADMPGFWQELRRRTLELRQTTDKALMVVAGGNLFEWGNFIRRMDNFLMDLYLEPDNVEALLDGLMERHLQMLSKISEYVGDIVDIIRVGDDLGAMNGPLMDPEIYRRFFKPRHKQLCDYVKQHSNMYTFLHSCGSIYQLIPDLIEAGFDILNPVQTQTRDMEPQKLKNEFGRDITFWGGGVETAGTLNKGTPGQVRDEVLQRLEIFSKEGGFVFNTIHNILPEVPPENIIAMFNAIKEFNGDKPINFT